MADDRKKKGGEPVLEFFWDSLELAADKTYSTTLRIKLTGWWEGGRPREVGVSIYQKGQEPPAGNAVRIQNGFGTFPLVGLEPGHHYLVVCYIEDRLPVQKMVAVPELPKLAKAELKIPKGISVTISGERGRQKLLISVSAEDDSLIPGFVGTLVDGGDIHKFKTDEDGLWIYQLNISEPSRQVQVLAGNTPDLVWQARLLGPRPERKE